MAQYAKSLPVDQNNNPYTVSTPNFPSNQSWSSVFTVSSTIGLSDRTTVIQIAAVGAPVNFKWGPGSVTGSSFDGTVSAGTATVYVVPSSILANAGSVMGANGANGLYSSISLKTVGGNAGSVFAAEF
jgi:hypothetical protein